MDDYAKAFRKDGKETTNKDRELTLFARDYAGVVIDEAHELRNIGTRHKAAKALASRAASKLCLTATPIITSILVRHIFN